MLDYTNPDAVDWWHKQMDQVRMYGSRGLWRDTPSECVHTFGWESVLDVVCILYIKCTYVGTYIHTAFYRRCG